MMTRMRLQKIVASTPRPEVDEDILVETALGSAPSTLPETNIPDMAPLSPVSVTLNVTATPRHTREDTLLQGPTQSVTEEEEDDLLGDLTDQQVLALNPGLQGANQLVSTPDARRPGSSTRTA